MSKITDSDMENGETQIWIDFAFHCGYISEELQKDLLEKSQEIGRMLNHMINNPDKYS